MAQPMWKPIPMPSSATAGRMASSVNRSLFQAGQLLSSGFEDMAKANTAAKQQASLPQLDFATEQITALNSSDQFTEENRKALLGQLTNQDARREANKVWEQQKASTLAEETAAAKEVRTGERHLKDLAKIDADILQSDRTGRANLMSASAAQQNAATNAAEFQFRKQTAADAKKELLDVTKLANEAKGMLRKGKNDTQVLTWLQEKTAGMTPQNQEAASKLYQSLQVTTPSQKLAAQAQDAVFKDAAAQEAAPLLAEKAQLEKQVLPIPTASPAQVTKAITDIVSRPDVIERNENEQFYQEALQYMPAAAESIRKGIQDEMAVLMTPELLASLGGSDTVLDAKSADYAKARDKFLKDYTGSTETAGYVNAGLLSTLSQYGETEINPLKEDLTMLGRPIAEQLVQNLAAQQDIKRLDTQLNTIKGNLGKLQLYAAMKNSSRIQQDSKLDSPETLANTFDKILAGKGK